MFHSLETRSAAILFLALLANLTSANAQEKGQAQPPSGVVYLSNVEYGKGGDQPLTLHLAMHGLAPARRNKELNR